VIHAIVLITAERDALGTLGGALAQIDGVTEAYSVTGDWDFVAVVRVREQNRLAELIANELAQLPGIERTTTLLAFQAFSQHDLEALFSIGG